MNYPATETNSNNANIRLISQGKWLKGLAKMGIASGLLSLLVTVLVYGLEEHIHKAIDTNSVENQQLYRLNKIDEYLYHTHLKYATFQKLSFIIFERFEQSITSVSLAWCTVGMHYQ